MDNGVVCTLEQGAVFWGQLSHVNTEIYTNKCLVLFADIAGGYLTGKRS